MSIPKRRSRSASPIQHSCDISSNAKRVRYSSPEDESDIDLTFSSEFDGGISEETCQGISSAVTSALQQLAEGLPFLRGALEMWDDEQTNLKMVHDLATGASAS
jgi:hypothetical protein